MKRIWFSAGIMLLLLLPLMYAQTNTMDQASEKSVQITSGPTVDASSGSTATIHWTTNKAGANHVKYREVGTNNWQSAYHAGGGTDHTLQLTGLQSGKTYEYQILTRDGDVRTSGQFQAGSATAASSNPGSAAPASASGTKVPLYRFVSTTSDEHFYNATATPQAGFRSEGVAGYLMQSQAPGTAAVYALTNSSDAMLSTNPSEGAGTFQNSGEVGFIATSQQPGTVPLYRMVNTKDGKHLETADPQEHSRLLSSGFKDDGIVGYVWQSPS